MSRFVKVEGESVWVNVERIDALIVRPQLLAVGGAHGQGALEELHEVTGRFEVAAMFQGQFGPIQTFATKAEAEAFVESFLKLRDQ